MSGLFYIEDFEELFTDVQLARIFPDSKTFTDAVPRQPVEEILAAYRSEWETKGFDLLTFVQQQFELPGDTDIHFVSDTSQSAKAHCIRLWDLLTRISIEAKGTKIALPEKFIIPGGRFREFFYWDSYFTMLGLQASGRVDLISSMVENFAYLTDTYGHIPNGTRTYFFSRSQPPFFSLMVELLSEELGNDIYLRYTPQLIAEYNFWMHGTMHLTDTSNAIDRIVRMPGNELLNRYWDNANTPRPEGYYEDVTIYEQVPPAARPDFYRNIRAACESGWDFSGRWLADGHELSSIYTTQLIPVDLNCLLWHLEATLEKCHVLAQDEITALLYRGKAAVRAAAIQKYLWNEAEGCYQDYHFPTGQLLNYPSMAMAFPLFMQLATNAQAEQVLQRMTNDFLQPGGLLTSTVESGQQWDAPNGWAPLQWVGYKAAVNYGNKDLASAIRNNWTRNVERVFKTTGKMMEKYNVADTSLIAGGGEYENQDGFGWTNGVYLRLLNENT